MESLPHRDRLFKEVVVRAVASPVSLFLGATGVLLAISPVAWPVGLGVLALDAGWIWTRIRDPRHAQTSSEDLLRRRWRELVTRLEELTTILDRNTAQVLASIVESQERLIGLCEGGAHLLSQPRAELNSLLQHCLALADRRHQLQTYLVTFSRHEIQQEVLQFRARVEGSPSVATQQLYQQALDQKVQELENYDRLEEAIERIDAQLAVVQCTFDNMLSKIVRMQSADRVVDEAASDVVVQELNQLTTRVAALEASVGETLNLRGAA